MHSQRYSQTKLQFQRITASPLFIAALFTIAKTWKQPECPLTDEWIKKMWCIYNGKLLSHKRNRIMPFAATWMDQRSPYRVMSDRERQIPYDII